MRGNPFSTTAAPPLSLLIDNCLRGEEASWALLWPLVVAASEGPLRQLVWAFHLDPGVVEDLKQELYLYLQARSGARLRAFRGRDAGQFCAFVRRVSRRCAGRCLARWRRVAGREAATGRAAALRRATAPTEGQVAAVYRDLVDLLSAPEREELRALLEREDGAAATDRSTRRRVARLYRRCAGGLL